MSPHQQSAHRARVCYLQSIVSSQRLLLHLAEGGGEDGRTGDEEEGEVEEEDASEGIAIESTDR